ncbi:MAG: DUF2911 domain-containing protein [Sphingobacteriales bacterium]
MRKLLTFKAAWLLAATFLLSTAAIAQKKPQASPADSTSGTVAGASIKISYHSPGIKGRTIGKEIAPYGKIWRTGANEATTFWTSKAIKVEGKTLPAGKYTLYTLPNETEWKIIFNSTTMDGNRPIWGIKMDGSTTDDAAKDVLAVTVKPMKSKSNNERFKIDVTKTGFVLLWGDIAVPVKIK